MSESSGRATDLRASATEFLRLAATGRVREAYQMYAHPKFRHHNAWFRGDADSLMAGMEDAARAHPDTKIDVKHALLDGPFVAVHSHVRHAPSDRGFAVVHLFRFEDDRVAELWDIVQPVPEESPNEHGMF